MSQSMGNAQSTGHSKEDLLWYARWRPKIWSNIIGDTFARVGWENLKGKKVLEIGYGRGRMAVMFARHGARYVGYENNAPRLPYAKQTAEENGAAESVEFRIGDFMKLEEKFDYVFVKSVLYHICEEQMYRAWLEKINSLLLPGGKFIALENGRGVCINRWIRRWYLRRSYSGALLYSERVEQMFREVFAAVDVRYFYILANLFPYPALFAKLETCFVKPGAGNCFAAGLICEQTER